MCRRHFGMECTPAARASFMLAGRPDAFRANSTPSERRLTRVVSPRPVDGDALASFRNTGASERELDGRRAVALTGIGTRPYYLTTRNLRCVTPGASTTRPCSSVIPDNATSSKSRSPSPRNTGTR